MHNKLLSVAIFVSAIMVSASLFVVGQSIEQAVRDTRPLQNPMPNELHVRVSNEMGFPLQIGGSTSSQNAPVHVNVTEK